MGPACSKLDIINTDKNLLTGDKLKKVVPEVEGMEKANHMTEGKQIQANIKCDYFYEISMLITHRVSPYFIPSHTLFRCAFSANDKN